jgi:hypothetical protein
MHVDDRPTEESSSEANMNRFEITGRFDDEGAPRRQRSGHHGSGRWIDIARRCSRHGFAAVNDEATPGSLSRAASRGHAQGEKKLNPNRTLVVCISC